MWPGTWYFALNVLEPGFLASNLIFGLETDSWPGTCFFGLEPDFWPGTQIFGLEPDFWPGTLIFGLEPDFWPGTWFLDRNRILAWNLMFGLEP